MIVLFYSDNITASNQPFPRFLEDIFKFNAKNSDMGENKTFWSI